MLKTGELACADIIKGDLDQEYWQAYLNFLQLYWLPPGCKLYCEDRRAASVPDFQRAMVNRMAESAPAVTCANVFYAGES